MRNTIAGVSLVIASVICILAYALIDERRYGADAPPLLAWWFYFIPGLFFLFLGRDKRPKLDKVDKSEPQS